MKGTAITVIPARRAFVFAPASALVFPAQTSPILMVDARLGADKFGFAFVERGDYARFCGVRPRAKSRSSSLLKLPGEAVTSEMARRRFAEIVLPHLDEAYGLARWLTGNGTDAEDVVQDACIRALASLDTATIERPGAWVLTIVRNTAFTWMAKNRPKNVLVTDDAQLLEMAAANASATSRDPEEALIAAADEAALEAAIQALPHIYREVVVMRDMNGLSYREIASAIDAPVGTVMSRLARGRATLMEKLGSRS